MAFKIAGSMAFKDAMRKANPVLLEPIMKVAVIVPDDYLGTVIRATLTPVVVRSRVRRTRSATAGRCSVPLSEMFGYCNDLRSKTQGRGQYTMEPRQL